MKHFPARNAAILEGSFSVPIIATLTVAIPTVGTVKPKSKLMLIHSAIVGGLAATGKLIVVSKVDQRNAGNERHEGEQEQHPRYKALKHVLYSRSASLM
jgi:hypothetical protein